MDKIDKAIESSQKLTSLLQEAKESLAYEKCRYDVRQDSGRKDRFMLFDIAFEKEVKYGNAREVRTWLERRAISEEVVYNYSLIKAKEDVKGASGDFE